MPQLTSNVVAVAAVLSAWCFPAVSALASGSLAVRQDVPCNPITQIGGGNGGRKLGIVIDASGSMSDNDPYNNRLAAAKALDQVFISAANVPSGKAADLVTVVRFSSSARVDYPIGDPAGAVDIIGKITPGGNTFIGSGIIAATQQILSTKDVTANRSGIVVFSDGLDNPQRLLNQSIEAIGNASSLGIRVSFGFLVAPSAGVPSPEVRAATALLQAAVKATGGTFVTLGNATGQQELFVASVLSNGLTGIDTQGGNSALFPGQATVAKLSSGQTSTFNYHVTAGEKINITARAIDSLALQLTVRNAVDNGVISTTQTNSTGVALTSYTATSDADLDVLVSGSDSNAQGLFEVGVTSSISATNFCTTFGNQTTSGGSGTAPGTKGTTNSTTNGTASGFVPVPYTGDASSSALIPHGLAVTAFLGLVWILVVE